MTSPESMIGVRDGRTCAQNDVCGPSLDQESGRELPAEQHVSGTGTPVAIESAHPLRPSGRSSKAPLRG
jgi:hypothetical protein